jgi:hypothetical protein
VDDSIAGAGAGSSPAPRDDCETMKIGDGGDRSRNPHALLDDSPFADESIDANLRLLLKIIVYLKSRSGLELSSPGLEGAPRVRRQKIAAPLDLSF